MSAHPVCLPEKSMDRGGWQATVHEVASVRHDLEHMTTTICSRCCAATATAESLQSCPTLCDPIDGSPPGSSVPGILQARTLEWVAISFSSA